MGTGGGRGGGPKFLAQFSSNSQTRAGAAVPLLLVSDPTTAKDPADPRSVFPTCPPTPNPQVRAQTLTLKAGLPSQGSASPNPETALDRLKPRSGAQDTASRLNADANRDHQFSIFLPPPPLRLEDTFHRLLALHLIPQGREESWAEAPPWLPPECRRQGKKKRTHQLHEEMKNTLRPPRAFTARARKCACASGLELHSQHALQRQGARPRSLTREGLLTFYLVAPWEWD